MGKKTLIIIIIILIIMMEIDRNYSFIWPVKDYYIQDFPLPIAGIYNTTIRTFNPSHKHKFNAYDFNSHNIIKSNFKDIQREALNLVNGNNKLLNMSDLYVGFEDIDKDIGKWKVFILKWYGPIVEKSKNMCPITCKILEQCPDVHAAMFSILEPGKHIPPHKGPSTACLRYHLGIQIPKDKDNCYIMVNGEKFNWIEGDALVFDDTYKHEVYNNTNERRIVLFIDIERPLNYPLNKINNTLAKNASIASFFKQVNDLAEKKETFGKLKNLIHR
jgi:beta-hydroxylase